MLRKLLVGAANGRAGRNLGRSFIFVATKNATRPKAKAKVAIVRSTSAHFRRSFRKREAAI